MLHAQEVSKKKGISIHCFDFNRFFLFIIINERRLNIKRQALSKSFRYSVCTTTGKVKNIRSNGPDLNYTFVVNGITYAGSSRFIDDGTVKYFDGKYFVIFQPEDPTNNKILLKYPASLYISNVSDSGWKEMPR